MPEYTVNIVDRFGAAFGASVGRIALNQLGVTYSVPPTLQQQNQVSPFIAGDVYTEDPVVYYSEVLKAPIFDRVEFFDGDKSTFFFKLPPLIDVELDKRLGITSTNDNDFDTTNINSAEVVESWNTSSWDITFRGILVDMQNHNRPLDQVKALVAAFKVDKPIDVTSKLFNAIGVKTIYTKKLSLPSMEGFRDTQPFVITAKSYAPAELLLN